MEEEEAALEAVCKWLTSAAGLRKAVVDQSRRLLKKESVGEVEDLVVLWEHGELGCVLPGRAAQLRVANALQVHVQDAGREEGPSTPSACQQSGGG